MTLHENRRQLFIYTAVIIVCSILGMGVTAYGITAAHTQSTRQSQIIDGLTQTVRGLERNSEQQEATAARTECVRAQSSALDDARWNTIAGLFGAKSRADAIAQGSSLQSLPTIATLENHGGTILGKYYKACPPPIAQATP